MTEIPLSYEALFGNLTSGDAKDLIRYLEDKVTIHPQSAASLHRQIAFSKRLEALVSARETLVGERHGKRGLGR